MPKVIYITKDLEMAKFWRIVNKKRMALGLDEVLTDEYGNPIRVNRKGQFVKL